MQDRWVSGIFADQEQAKQVLRVLSKNFASQNISIFGADENELTELAVPENVKMDSVMTFCGIAGMVIGLIAGATVVWPQGQMLVVSPLLAGFMGAAAGWCLGIVFGAILHFDASPAYRKVGLARLDTGRFMIVVHTCSRDERYLAESIMDEFDVSEVVAKSKSFAGS